MKLTTLIKVGLIFSSGVANAQSQRLMDFVRTIEYYNYSSLRLSSLISYGCQNYIPGLPVGFSLPAIQAEIVENSPKAAREKVSKFISDPKYGSAIEVQMNWMPNYKASKSSSDFSAMCADLGGQALLEWRTHRASFFRVAKDYEAIGN